MIKEGLIKIFIRCMLVALFFNSCVGVYPTPPGDPTWRGACTYHHDMEAYFNMYGIKDFLAMQTMIDNGDCDRFKSDNTTEYISRHKVQIVNEIGFFVEFRPIGKTDTYWTWFQWVR